VCIVPLKVSRSSKGSDEAESNGVRRENLSAVGKAAASSILLIVSIVAALAQEKGAVQAAGPQPGTPSPRSHHDLSVQDLWAKNTEDLSTPSLRGSEFAPTNAVAYEKDSEGSFTREIVRVGWRLGDPIDLYIIRPVTAKKVPVIIYLYSYPFETDRFRDKSFSQFLVQDGVAAVGFATALTGQRYHDRPMKEWFVSEMKEALATSAHDVQLVLNYLATRSDLNLDLSRVGIFGDGSGATIAILAASVDPRIKALDLLDPWGDWPDWMSESTLVPDAERAGFLQPEFLAGIADFDPVKVLPALHNQKVRMREILSVTVTPNEAKKKIEAAAPPNVDLVRYQSSQDFRTAAASQGFAWIKEQLRPEPDRAAREGGSQTSSTQASKSQP